MEVTALLLTTSWFNFLHLFSMFVSLRIEKCQMITNLSEIEATLQI